MSYQGITTKELAEKSGVNKRTIDHYLMTNPQEPSAANALKIATALGVSVEYLMTGKEYKSKVTVTGDILDLIQSYQNFSSEQQKLILSFFKTFDK